MPPFAPLLVRKVLTFMLASAASLIAAAASVRVDPVTDWPEHGVALVARPVGRVEPRAGAAGWRYQWPGTYFEARFAGDAVYVDLGGGDKHARVSIDGHEVADLLRPHARLLRLHGLAPGEHEVRVDIVSESADGVQTFGGFAVPDRAFVRAPRTRERAIEFIGDSYTVGYASASSRRECSDDEVWRTTDNSLAFGPQVARRFDADYRILAISGRGMVRNFSNGAGDTLPVAYDRLLPGDDLAAAAAGDPAWSPQLIVIGLGTNDFSMPVAPGEPWRDTAALAAAFEWRYVEFARALHRRHPAARMLLLASDAGDGAAERAIRRVQPRLAGEGIAVGEVLALGPLALDACNWHPSRADQAAIAQRLVPAIARLMPGWHS
jgi:lysophospholipase L1-like esterase